MNVRLVRVAIAPWTDKDTIEYGLFVGLLSNASSCDRCSNDGYSAVVLIDGHGMIASLLHPSRVTFIGQDRE